MIWTIRDLKKKARKLLKNCYWPAVAVCLLTTMLTGWIGSAGIGIGRIQAENASGLEMSEQRMRELKDDLKDRNPIAEYKISIVQKQLNLLVFVFAVTASIVIVVLGLLVIFCIGNPVKVSSKRFFMLQPEKDSQHRHDSVCVSESLYDACDSGDVLPYSQYHRAWFVACRTGHYKAL